MLNAYHIHPYRIGGAFPLCAEIMLKTIDKGKIQFFQKYIVSFVFLFNIAVSNCDDHLRNQGFILDDKGWQLSPIYDINPDESRMGLKLNISENDNSLDFNLALNISNYFGINYERAIIIMNEIKSVVSDWSRYATGIGISRTEQILVAKAFRY